MVVLQLVSPRDAIALVAADPRLSGLDVLPRGGLSSQLIDEMLKKHGGGIGGDAKKP